MNVFIKIFTGKNEVLLIPMKTSVIPSIFYHLFLFPLLFLCKDIHVHNPSSSPSTPLRLLTQNTVSRTKYLSSCTLSVFLLFYPS